MLATPVSLQSYAWALAAVLAAMFFRLLMDPLLGEQLPYHAFYFAIAGVAAWRGFGPGLLVLVIGLFVANVLFAAPRFSLDLSGPGHLIGAFRFISIGLLLAIVGNWGRTQRLRSQLEMGAKERDLVSARQEKEHTQHLLASIGDGLITVDLKGKVTFMNPVAERLSGWNADTAHGRPVVEVLPLVDARSRDAVPNPAIRSLTNGDIALLPENVVLLARDGVERVIDDSAAPIRDGCGNIIGSVLIFRDITDRRSTIGPSRSQVPYLLASLHLASSDGWQQRVSPAELAELDHACRTWIAREWQPQEKAVRMVSLNGFDLIIRQERTEQSAAHGARIHFSVIYERP